MPDEEAPVLPAVSQPPLFDKCRTDFIGCYDGEIARTPHLDDLAAGGVRFTHAYTPQALCGPARASMLD